ncbi:MAG: hypothetical protein ACJ73D_07935 [Pyrinomonadaceae bacterium]
MTKLFLAIFATFLMVGSAISQGQVIYNSIPSPGAGNYPSLAFEATSTSEFGDRLQFAGSARNLLTVTQTMSSWGCENGTWQSACSTTPGATFAHPITLKIYSVGLGNQPGSLLGTFTQTFNIPFRPSADPVHCGSRWYNGTSCFNGYATDITFNTGGLLVPTNVIYSISYNTSDYGAAPIGYTAPCHSTAAGCGYDSLNVALTGPTTVGVNPSPDDAYLSSLWGGAYCDNGASGVGTFRLDAGCWIGFKPNTRFAAAYPATTPDQCKKDGWIARTRADGTAFKNQGDCVSYTNNGK